MTARRVVFAIFLMAFIALISRFSIPLHAPDPRKSPVATASVLEAIRGIESGQQTTPLITDVSSDGDVSMTFLAKRSGKDIPRIVSDATGWGERANGTFDFSVGKMSAIADTEWYSLQTKAQSAARIEYLIVYGAGDYRIDPNNPRQSQRVGGPASEVQLPGYVLPQEFIDPPTTPAGALTEAIVESHVMKDARRVIVYTPPGYRADMEYPLALFHDGALMVNSGQAPRVIDWLIAHKAIEPIIAVFVDPQSRALDYRRGAPMRAFVTDELLSWIASRYSIAAQSSRRAIIGVSAGARGALDAASSSSAFGRLGLMIPAPDSADINAIPQASAHHLQVSIIGARYDTLNRAASMDVRRVLTERGHLVDFKEVSEGHSTSTWRTHLRDVLISLFGRT